MNKKYPWLPIDERVIPDIFSFQYPKSPWVRLALLVEMVCAVLAVIGTLLLTFLPRSFSQKTSTTTSVTTNVVSPAP